MNNLQLIRALHQGIWLMDLSAAEAYRTLAEQIINGQPLTAINLLDGDGKSKLTKEAKTVRLSAATQNPMYGKLDKAAPGSIAVYPIQSVIMQDDYCGAPGLKTIRSWMEQGESSGNITAHLLHMNTPGGDASGVEEFALFVKSLKKPVMAFVEGMAASGGLWIAAAADETIVSEDLSMVGSLGAFSTFYDSTKRMTDAGVRKIEVYATQSSKKNRIYKELVSMDEEVAAAAKAEYATRFLNPLVTRFQNAVTTFRAKSASKMTDDVMAGDMFSGSEAINVGLADGMMTFNQAINRLQNLKK